MVLQKRVRGNQKQKDDLMMMVLLNVCVTPRTQ